ncbi:MAG: hypothetical protein P4M01_12055 [Acidobacteriota bacterium]|nr:hypothetical protein [Acidobacteriota bacterium]
MPSPTIIVAQNDPEVALGLANDLHAHFARVAVANNAVELRTLLAHHEARVAVLDLELLDLKEIAELAGRYTGVAIVCTHRSPDERMWTNILRAGAVELCVPRDLRAILRASRAAVRYVRQDAA